MKRTLRRKTVRAGSARRTKRTRRTAKNVLPASTFYQYVASMNPIESPKTVGDAVKIVKDWVKADDAVRSAAPIAASNPSLMILMNPRKKKAKKKRKNKVAAVRTQPREVALANKAYKSFHFKDHSKQETHSVPDNWPKKPFWVLGVVDRFDARTAAGKTISRQFKSNRPILASTKDRKDIFLIRNKGKLGIPSGKGVRIDYSVPQKSGRMKWAQKWWHPHESNPTVISHSGGHHTKVTGPGLSITPRGIIG